MLILIENINKHIAWYTKGKCIVIVHVHGHMTITVLLVKDCIWLARLRCELYTHLLAVFEINSLQGIWGSLHGSF